MNLWQLTWKSHQCNYRKTTPKSNKENLCVNLISIIHFIYSDFIFEVLSKRKALFPSLPSPVVAEMTTWHSDHPSSGPGNNPYNSVSRSQQNNAAASKINDVSSSSHTFLSSPNPPLISPAHRPSVLSCAWRYAGWQHVALNKYCYQQTGTVSLSPHSRHKRCDSETQKAAWTVLK